MSQIEDLQQRVLAAMDRIGAGIAAMESSGASDGVEEGKLRVALEDERLVNAQLEERLKSVKERYEQEIDTLREQLGQANARLASVEAARAELAEAKAALENQDEVAALKAEIEDLQSRQIESADTAALEAEIALLRPAAAKAEGAQAEIARLRAELADSERVADLNAELEMLRAERTSHGAAMSRLDDDLQRLRKANDQLRAAVDELREAAEDGMPDADMLNRAMVAELEATRAARASDAAEAHAVLARLEPLLTHANLAEGEVE